jgi:hypothetical protein
LWQEGGNSNPANPSFMAIDGAGNIVLGGAYLAGAPDFGNGPLPASGQTQFGFVAKFDAKGTALWSQGSISARGMGHAVALDGAGNVLVADVDTSGLYVQKLDPSGQQVWRKSWTVVPAPPSCNGQAADASSRFTVGADAAGNVVVGGTLVTWCSNLPLVPDFGGGALPTGGTTSLAKLDPNGTLLWSKALGASDGLPSGEDAIAVDAAGGIYFRENGASPRLHKLSPDGSLAWSQPVPAGVTLADAPPVQFAPGGTLVYISNTQTPGNTANVTKLDAQLGNTLWTKSFAETGSCTSLLRGVFVFDAAVGPSGEMFIAGDFGGPGCTLDFGAGPVPYGAVYLAKLDANGNGLWSTSYGANFSNVYPWPMPLAVAATGHLVVSGTFASTSLDLKTGLGALTGGSAFFMADVGP